MCIGFDAKYACVYGISNPVSNIEPGCNFFVYRPEASIIVFSGKGGVLYWFILNDLKQHPIRYETPQIFSEKDINVLYLTIADTTVTEGVNFADIYKQKRTAVMTALEEGVADSLFSGRLFVLGDSAHKVCPLLSLVAFCFPLTRFFSLYLIQTYLHLFY